MLLFVGDDASMRAFFYALGGLYAIVVHSYFCLSPLWRIYGA